MNDGEDAPPRKKNSPAELWLVGAFIGVWLLLQAVVLPRAGVPT